MKKTYRLRKKQDIQLGREPATTAVLTFEVNEEPLQQKTNMGDAVIETFWNIAGFKLQG